MDTMDESREDKIRNITAACELLRTHWQVYYQRNDGGVVSRLKTLVDAVIDLPEEELHVFAITLAKYQFTVFIYLISHVPSLVHLKDKEEWTVLHWAIESTPDLISTLVGMGLDINALTVYHHTSLDLSFEFHHPNSALRLLKEGASTRVGERKWRKCENNTKVAKVIRRCYYLSFLYPLEGLLDVHKRLVIEMLV